MPCWLNLDDSNEVAKTLSHDFLANNWQDRIQIKLESEESITCPPWSTWWERTDRESILKHQRIYKTMRGRKGALLLLKSEDIWQLLDVVLTFYGHVKIRNW